MSTTSTVSSITIMAARAVSATPFATAGSDEKCAACREIGAAEAINYRTQDFVEMCKSYTQGKGVNVVLDIVGASYLEKNLDVLATEGRLSMPRSCSRREPTSCSRFTTRLTARK